MDSKCFFKHFVNTPVAPISTGVIIISVFQIRSIAVHLLFFSASICVTLLSAAMFHITHIFSFSFLIIIFGLFVLTPVRCLCVPFDSITLLHYHVHILARGEHDECVGEMRGKKHVTGS